MKIISLAPLVFSFNPSDFIGADAAQLLSNLPINALLDLLDGAQLGPASITSDGIVVIVVEI